MEAHAAESAERFDGGGSTVVQMHLREGGCGVYSLWRLLATVHLEYCKNSNARPVCYVSPLWDRSRRVTANSPKEGKIHSALPREAITTT